MPQEKVKDFKALSGLGTDSHGNLRVPFFAFLGLSKHQGDPKLLRSSTDNFRPLRVLRSWSRPPGKGVCCEGHPVFPQKDRNIWWFQQETGGFQQKNWNQTRSNDDLKRKIP